MNQIAIFTFVLFLTSFVFCQETTTKTEDLELDQQLLEKLGKELELIFEQCEEPVCKKLSSKSLFKTFGLIGSKARALELINAICGNGGADAVADAVAKKFKKSSNLPSKYLLWGHKDSFLISLIYEIKRRCIVGGIETITIFKQPKGHPNTRQRLIHLLDSIPPKQLKEIEKIIQTRINQGQ